MTVELKIMVKKGLFAIIGRISPTESPIGVLVIVRLTENGQFAARDFRLRSGFDLSE